MRVRPRSLLIAFAVLVALDLVLRLPIGLPVPRDFRLPNRTTMGLSQFISSMSRQQGVRIAVVGDSIVWGGFAEPNDTLSAHLTDIYEAAHANVRAYNLGMNGAHANDLYPLVALLAQEQAADVIVLNFDMRFYADSPVVQRYPELYEMAARTMVEARVQGLDGGRRQGSPAGIEQRIDAIASRAWRLYALRDYVAAALLGDRPGSALNHRMHLIRADLIGPSLYAKKPASKLPLDEIREAFSVDPLAETDTYLRYLTAAIDIARDSGIEVVVFAGPVDSGLLDAYGLWNRAAYEANLERVARIVEAHGATFRPYTDAVPARLISDSHHPLGPGYQVLAEAISRDISPLVRAAVEHRQAEDAGGDHR